jgi:hypothetical protein
MRKINLLQIILHFIATWLFVCSFRAFSCLSSLRLLELIRSNGIERLRNNFEKYGLTTVEIWRFTFMIAISSIVAIVIAFAISVIISIRRKWSLLNSFAVLLLSLLFSKFYFLDALFKKMVSPLRFISNLSIQYSSIGILFLIAGTLLFCLKRVNEKIDKAAASTAIGSKL